MEGDTAHSDGHIFANSHPIQERDTLIDLKIDSPLIYLEKSGETIYYININCFSYKWSTTSFFA